MSRSFRPIAIRVLAGLAATVAACWASAGFLGFPQSIEAIRARGLSARDWHILARSRRPGAVRYTSVVMIRALEYREATSGLRVPAWAASAEPGVSTPQNRAEHYELCDGYGWPLPALSFRFHGRGNGASATGEVTGGIPLPARSTGAWYDPRALPLTPIWPGFVVDWAIATGTVVAAWDGPRLLRRKLRLRAGRCLSCGYDLRGLGSVPCPECGRITPAPRA
jgi:hypothetical protein